VSTDVENPVLDYVWNFGDGVSLHGDKAAHAYTHAGSYDVTLESSGFGPQRNIQKFHVAVTGSVSTKFAPTRQRRFKQDEP
jgi:phage baseplate assembly protein gpV